MSDAAEVRSVLFKEIDREWQAAKGWADRAEASVLSQLALVGQLAVNTEAPNLLKVAAAWTGDSLGSHINEIGLDILRRRLLAVGWHSVERVERPKLDAANLSSGDDSRYLWLGRMVRLVTVHMGDGESFAAPYDPELTPEEIARTAVKDGARRPLRDKWEYIPSHRISHASITDPSSG